MAIPSEYCETGAHDVYVPEVKVQYADVQKAYVADVIVAPATICLPCAVAWARNLEWHPGMLCCAVPICAVAMLLPARPHNGTPSVQPQ